MASNSEFSVSLVRVGLLCCVVCVALLMFCVSFLSCAFEGVGGIQSDLVYSFGVGFCELRKK